VQVNTSKYNRTMVFSTTDPYFTPGRRLAHGRSVLPHAKPYQDQGGNYELVTMGAGLRFGVPFTELDTVFFGGGAERTRIKPGTNIPAAYLAYANRLATPARPSPDPGLVARLRDSALAPNSGRYQRLLGRAGPVRRCALRQGQLPVPAVRPAEQAVHAGLQRRAGLGQGPGRPPFPVFKNFYSGGLGSVRGFEQGTWARAT
jgi:outer membrane protein insertion porin family